MDRTPIIFDIEDETLVNDSFRRVIATSNEMQLVLMSLPVGDEIGLEIHPHTTQFIRIESGEALFSLGRRKDHLVKNVAGAGYAALIPAGTWHNVVNIGDEPLQLYTLYSPPEHPSALVERDNPRKTY